MSSEPKDEETLEQEYEAARNVNEEYPPIDFTTLMLSLSTSALVSLGEVTDPSSSKSERNLPLARQTVDVLMLLEEKTRGNLTGEEERLLGQLLYELRLRYIAEAKKPTA